MLRLLTVTVLLSLLCHQGCVGGPINTVGAPGDIGLQTWLLVDPEKPRPNMEEGKKRRITPKSVFIAPAFSGTSHLPDCAEGYRPDSMGRCVKLVQLNHAAQLDFLLQRLNAMYAAPAVRRGSGGISTSDSSSTGPLQVSIPIEIPPEPEEETKESVEVAVVMADVLKDNQLKNSNKKNETKKSQTIVAVWNVGKNGTSLDEIESSSDLEMESENLNFGKTDLKLITSDATKYKIVNKSENSTAPKTSDDSGQTLQETIKVPYSAMGLLEEVSNISSEDGRSGNTSRRNASADQEAKKEDTSESFPTATEAVVVKVVNASGTKQIRNASNMHGSQSEVRVTSEIETKVLPASTYRPRTFVRFPTEKSPVGADNNVASSNGVRAEDTRHLIEFQQTRFGFQRPGPMLPSDVHQRQTFWWLPAGWRLDPTRHQPMLITFWARMPLLRDHDIGVTDSHQDTNTGRRRGPLVY
jgi:hypothetical protein